MRVQPTSCFNSWNQQLHFCGIRDPGGLLTGSFGSRRYPCKSLTKHARLILSRPAQTESFASIACKHRAKRTILGQCDTQKLYLTLQEYAVLSVVKLCYSKFAQSGILTRRKICGSSHKENRISVPWRSQHFCSKPGRCF